MAKFLQHRELVEIPEFVHEWHDINDTSAGYYVPCEKDGTIRASNYSANLPNAEDVLAKKIILYNDLMTGQYNGRTYEYDGIIDRSHSYWEPAVIECEKCQSEVSLDYSMTNTCKCGAEYNSSGQRLAPREQWGEETGETWYDVPNDPLY